MKKSDIRQASTNVKMPKMATSKLIKPRGKQGTDSPSANTLCSDLQLTELY